MPRLEALYITIVEVHSGAIKLKKVGFIVETTLMS